MKLLLQVFVLILMVPLAMADDDFSKEIVKATDLTSSMYMLEGAGGNMTALIGPEGTLLVDDDFAQMADKLLTKLKELNGSGPRFIINTHFHYDHTGGNEVFGSSATIIGTNELRQRLMSEQTLWKKQHPPMPPQAWPTLTFENQITLYLNGETVHLLHLPHGHTDGDTVIFFQKNKVASLGDLYFSGMYPIFHLEHKGSLEGYIHNIEIVLKRLPEDGKIVPGHGPLSTKAELKRYHQMILASVATVKRGIKSKKTLEQIKSAGLDPEWESYGRGYVTTDGWIAMIYKALNYR